MSTSPRGSAAAGTRSSIRGSGMISSRADWERVRAMAGQIQIRSKDAAPKAYSPAATSSNTIPQPSGRLSRRRIGNGLVMSKRRKRIRAMIPWRQSAGQNSNVIHWPATSSITTNPGSCRPLSLAAIVAAGTPKAMVNTAPTARKTRSPRGPAGRPRATPVHKSTAATDPQVPGPGFPRPAPKKVATVQAQSVLRVPAGDSGAATDSLIVRIPAPASAQATEVFEHLRVQHRRTYLVDAHCPLAKVNLAATVTAKREVLILGTNKHATSRAVENFRGF